MTFHLRHAPKVSRVNIFGATEGDYKMPTIYFVSEEKQYEYFINVPWTQVVLTFHKGVTNKYVGYFASPTKNVSHIHVFFVISLLYSMTGFCFVAV